MKTHLPPHAAFIFTTLLTLLVAASALALPITPVSYDMKNGGGGTYSYWDDSYSGSGSKTTNYALLRGGLGDLTDGVIATQNWNKAEAPAGPGPYVGWAINPIITFHFGSVVNLDSLTLYLDDPSSGGVYLPGSVTLGMGGSTSNYAVVNPPTATPLPVTFSDLGFSGEALTMTLNRQNNTGWVFLSEVTFDDGTVATMRSMSMQEPASVPEPGTIFLLGAGLVGLASYNRRRKHIS